MMLLCMLLFLSSNSPATHPSIYRSLKIFFLFPQSLPPLLLHSLPSLPIFPHFSVSLVVPFFRLLFLALFLIPYHFIPIFSIIILIPHPPVPYDPLLLVPILLCSFSSLYSTFILLLFIFPFLILLPLPSLLAFSSLSLHNNIFVLI